MDKTFMGWDYIRGLKRPDLIKRLTEDKNFESSEGKMVTRHVQGYALCGNTLWVLQTDIVDGETETYIMCHLVHFGDFQSGYKSMSAMCHPYYYSCPLPFLEKAPMENIEWRSRVLDFHRDYPNTYRCMRIVDGREVWEQ